MFLKTITGLLILFLLCMPASPPAPAQSLSREAELFQKYKNGIVTILSDEGRGSGFLVSKQGLVLTNHHVVINSVTIQVQINDALRVESKCIAHDRQKDVAVLYIHPRFVADIPVLPLCGNDPDSLKAGDHVVAIGNPLRQTKIITAGIISKVEERVIFSDVNINPGSSGGPLLNLQGKVVGINTFGDFSSIGPGIAGSIAISSAFNVIAEAKDKIKTVPSPSEQRIVLPREQKYPLWGYEMAFLKLPPGAWEDNGVIASYGGVIAYDHLNRIKTPVYCLKKHDLSITFYTPPFIYKIKNYYKSKMNELITQSSRVSQSAWNIFYDPFENIKEWMQDTGYSASSVIISVIPLPQHTGSTAFNPGKDAYLLSQDAPSVNELGRAVVDLALRREDQDLAALDRHFRYTTYYFIRTDEEALQRVNEISRIGAFSYTYSHFAPKEDNWPHLELEILLANDLNDTLVVKVPQQTLEQIWFDFEPLRLQNKYDEKERK
ncbi:trypsin-like serine protease [candidate division KSB1 bacterium]|nr:trypsin-like serine protease [candidate division KSB1 bacterium]